MKIHTGKTAIVTGASSGIGKATAAALARAGFTVFRTSRRNIENGPEQVTMLACDVTDEESVRKLVSDVLARTGRIDLLVNNAGLGLFGGAEESSVEQAKSLFEVNFFDLVRMTNAVLPSMRNIGGRRDRGRESGDGRQAAPRQPALDAAYACHPCAAARRGTDDRARQPAPCVAGGHLDLSAYRRSPAGAPTRRGI